MFVRTQVEKSTHMRETLFNWKIEGRASRPPPPLFGGSHFPIHSICYRWCVPQDPQYIVYHHAGHAVTLSLYEFCSHQDRPVCIVPNHPTPPTCSQ